MTGTTAHGERRRRIDAQRNIRAIVLAATRVLSEHPRASIRDIAGAAGVHRATVHRHFPTRDDLLLAVREQALDDFAALAGAPGLAEREPAAAVAELTRRTLAVGDRSRAYRVTTLFDGDREAELVGPVTALMARAQATGAVRADLPPELAAVAWGGLVLAALPRMAAGMALDAAAGFVLTMLATPAGRSARG